MICFKEAKSKGVERKKNGCRLFGLESDGRHAPIKQDHHSLVSIIDIWQMAATIDVVPTPTMNCH